MFAIGEDLEVGVLAGGEEAGARRSRLPTRAGNGVAAPDALSFRRQEAAHMAVQGDEAMLMHERERVEPLSPIGHRAHDAVGGGENRRSLENGDVDALMRDAEALFVRRITERRGNFANGIHGPCESDGIRSLRIGVPSAPSHRLILRVPQFPQRFTNAVFRCAAILQECHELRARPAPLLCPFRDIREFPAALLFLEEAELVPQNFLLPLEYLLLRAGSADRVFRSLHQLRRFPPSASDGIRSSAGSKEQKTYSKDDGGSMPFH